MLSDVVLTNEDIVEAVTRYASGSVHVAEVGGRKPDSSALIDYFYRRDNTPPREAFTLLEPLVELVSRNPLTGEKWKSTLTVITAAVGHPDCPESLLLLACLSGRERYAITAARNPKCPAEAQVAAWLEFGPGPDIGSFLR